MGGVEWSDVGRPARAVRWFAVLLAKQVQALRGALMQAVPFHAQTLAHMNAGSVARCA